MGGVHLDHIEPGGGRAARPGHPGVDVLDPDLGGHRLGFAQRNRAGTDRLPGMFAPQFHVFLRHRRTAMPGAPSAGLAAGVLQLDRGHRSLCPYEIGDAAQGGMWSSLQMPRSA